MQESKTITAILVDDEQSVLSGLQNIIDFDRFQIKLVGLASDGVEALKLLLEWQPDFAVVDINMPGMSGLDMIREARANGISTDFIILSGFSEFSYAQQAIAQGAKAYLLKPVNAEELNNQIGQICLEHSKYSQTPVNQKYTQHLIDNYFNRLIEGKYSDISSISSFLQSLDLSIGLGNCYMMVLQYDNEIKEPEKMLHVLNGTFSNTSHVFWQIDSVKLAALFNISEETPFHLAMKIIDTMTSNGYPEPLIGIGDIVNQLTNASYSYGRAMTALSYKLFETNSRIFPSEVICTTAPTLRLQEIDCLPLVQHIVKRDKAAIKSFCNDFFNSLLYVKMPPPNYVYSMCYALFAQIQKEFSNIMQENINDFASSQELYQCANTQQIIDWLCNTFCKLSDLVDAIYGYSNPQAEKRVDISGIDDDIVVNAQKYIKENIAKHIKLEDIARSVHLSPSYFATYFKEKTGANLRDFLLQTKMEYAAQALRSDNQTVMEVADALGYSDYRSFSRAFKNVYGCTPSDFQNS